ncbi:hypothetical protein J6590_041141 [Homalodisca vitripennis]|nr:hypothetical protein J6590_041141 [Homalodisca vitripennis]
MDCSRSLLSENTLRRVVEEEFLNDNFVSHISEPESSQDESSSSVVDDTDSDPDYIPDNELSQNRTSNFANSTPT